MGKRDRGDDGGLEGCPHPEKRAYTHKNHAEDARARLKWSDAVEAYRCRCGAWHLGHPKPKNICVWCNQPFFPWPGQEETQLYCSTQHAKRAWEARKRGT